MSYFYFLKRQIFTFLFVFVVSILSYGADSFFCLGSIYSPPMEYVITFSLVYIFFGVYVRFLMYEQECDVFDEN